MNPDRLGDLIGPSTGPSMAIAAVVIHALNSVACTVRLILILLAAAAPLALAVWLWANLRPGG